MDIQMLEAFRIPNRQNQKINSLRHIIVKMPTNKTNKNKERILKVAREKLQTNQNNSRFLTEILKARRTCISSPQRK